MSQALRIPRLVLTLVALAALVALTVAFVPWKTVLETQITKALEKQGFENVHLTLSDVGLRSFSLKDIAFGGKQPLALNNITLNYSLADLLTGKLTTKATGVQFKAQGINVTAADVTLDTTPRTKDGPWNGQWQIKDIKVSGIDPPLPLLNGSGTISADADQVTIQGRLASVDQTYKTSLHVSYRLDAPTKSTLAISDAIMPWNGGTVGVGHATLPLKPAQDITVNLTLQHILANSLLQQLTGERATATGTVSGTLPVSFMADGAIIVHQGSLQADTPGIITMSPEVIPGDNEQVALVRDVLKNFHYTILTAKVDSDTANKLVVMMSLEGSNPDVSAGRAVKMNVRLTGDVLNFIQQNLLWLLNPEKFLERGKNEKN